MNKENCELSLNVENQLNAQPPSSSYIRGPAVDSLNEFGISNYFYKSFDEFRNKKSHSNENKKKIIIAQINVQGINEKKKFDKIKDEINNFDFKIDIIVFSETKLKDEKIKSNIIYEIPCYSIYICSRYSENSGGGVLVFIREGLEVEEMSKHSSAFEMIKIKLKNPHHIQEYISILCYYRQPKNFSFGPFLKNIGNELEQSEPHTIIIGDINLDANLVKKTDSQSKQYIDKLKCYNFITTNNIPTGKESSRVIDHFTINFKNEYSVKNFTIKNDISDHRMVLSILTKVPESIIKHSTEIINPENIFGECDSFMNIKDTNTLANKLIVMTQKALNVKPENEGNGENKNRTHNEVQNKSNGFNSLPAEANESVSIPKATDGEIKGIIRKLRNSPSDFYGIEVKPFKKIAHHIIPYIEHLVNKIFESRVYPVSLTIVKEIRQANFCKSVWPVYSRIVEKILRNRLYDAVHGKIPKNQFGLRKNCNNEMALNDLIYMINNKKYIIKHISLTLFNVKNAFDYININNLMNILKDHGVADNMKQLVRSYLNNRKQKKKFKETILTQCLDRESVLSNFLFILYINSISEKDLKGTLYMYNTSCILLNYHNESSKKYENLQQEIKFDMINIINKLDELELKLNLEKTQCLLLGKNFYSDSFIEIKNTKIDIKISIVESLNYLGLTIDTHNIFWRNHISKIQHQIGLACGFLWHNRTKQSFKEKKSYYLKKIEMPLKSLVSIWGMADFSVIKELQSFQNMALRSVFNLEKSFIHDNKSVISTYNNKVKNHLPTVGLFHLKIIGIVYSIINKKKYINNIEFKKNMEGLEPNDCNKNFKSLTCLGIKLFNEIPEKIRSLTNYNSFMAQLKRYLYFIKDNKKEELITSYLSGTFLKHYKSNINSNFQKEQKRKRSSKRSSRRSSKRSSRRSSRRSSKRSSRRSSKRTANHIKCM